MSQKISQLKDVKLHMYNHGKKVFSGPIKEYPEYISDDQTIDRCDFFNSNDSLIMSMKYKDFKKFFGDNFQ